MGAIQYELRGESPEEGLIDELAAVHPRIGVEGLLRRRGIRAWPGRVPAGAAVEGFRWGPVDSLTPRWWPQGVEVLDEHDGLLVVSWFAQKRRGTSQGARISVVDRRDPARPRYHHVLLVEPTRDAQGKADMAPIQVHAGGLAVLGHRLFAAATFGGLRVFDLRDIMQLTGRGPFGYRCVLPQSAHQRLHGGDGDERMRFSFVSVERDATGGDDAGGDHLVVGEFGQHETGRRLGRIPVAGLTLSVEPTTVTEVHEPGIPRMQGAAVIDGTWFVSASNGLKPGDLWVGSGASWTCHRGVLPAGPEDLCSTADGRLLWSLCEYPRRRWVYAMDPARWSSLSRPGPG